jgi:hypothetical protein
MVSDVHAEEEEKCEHRECILLSRSVAHNGRIRRYDSKRE